MDSLAEKIAIYYRLVEALLTSQKTCPFGFDKKRSTVKNEVHRLSEFFISKTWGLMEAELFEKPWFGLSTDKTFDELKIYLREIESRSSAFPWAWMRARSTEAIVSRLEALLPRLAEQYPKEFEAYTKALHRAGIYWFRQSPKQHLIAGYHTALSAIWKVLGEEHYYLRDTREWSDEDSLRVKKALRGFATFHMEYLLASDGYLWDSAGATAYRWSDDTRDDKTLLNEIHARADEKAPGRMEGRLGCPAIRAKYGGSTVFDGVWDWCLTVFVQVYR